MLWLCAVVLVLLGSMTGTSARLVYAGPGGSYQPTWSSSPVSLYNPAASLPSINVTGLALGDYYEIVLGGTYEQDFDIAKQISVHVGSTAVAQTTYITSVLFLTTPCVWSIQLRLQCTSAWDGSSADVAVIGQYSYSDIASELSAPVFRFGTGEAVALSAAGLQTLDVRHVFPPSQAPAVTVSLVTRLSLSDA